MSVGSLGLAVLWLLPLTSGQNHTAAHGSTEDRTTGWSPVSETPPASTMFVPGSEAAAAATPTDSTPPRFDRSTEGRKSTTSSAHASDSIGTTRAPPGSSAQTPTQPATRLVSTQPATRLVSTQPATRLVSTQPATRLVSTQPATRLVSTQPATRLVSTQPATRLVSTVSTSTGPAESGGTSTSPVPAASYRTPKAATRPGKEEEPDEGPNHGKVVAGLIGGALLVMVVGFLLIYVKKRRLQNRQMATDDWAGPSPFLAGGADGGGGRASTSPSNRISLSSFLTQRLSRRLSALPETGEEFADMTASTFGGKGSLFAREEDGKAGLGPGGRSNGDTPETAEHHHNNHNNNNNNDDDNSEVA
ncbi:mucin-7-like isoform X1 [Cyclopterus lumpus]|uniref:mucin-7-like isoform X1 n=1 Tax=Cyclopterus lumpus TaxID=8103 RepID=UPI0014874316|nr:mucin-7-like isoform X1 [Cyclopterus lumpus]